MALTDAMENAALDWLTGNGTPVRPTSPLVIRLMTANGDDATAGTELATSGGYTAGGKSATLTAAASGLSTNSSEVSWTNMPATTIVGVELWDSAATPVRIAWASTTSTTLAAGDTLTYAAGAIDFTLA